MSLDETSQFCTYRPAVCPRPRIAAAQERSRSADICYEVRPFFLAKLHLCEAGQSPSKVHAQWYSLAVLYAIYRHCKGDAPACSRDGCAVLVARTVSDGAKLALDKAPRVADLASDRKVRECLTC